MSEVTREEKIETILEWWLDGWQDSHHDINILTDELVGLHTTEQIPLYKYNDDELNQTYEDVMKAIISLRQDLGYE